MIEKQIEYYVLMGQEYIGRTFNSNNTVFSKMAANMADIMITAISQNLFLYRVLLQFKRWRTKWGLYGVAEQKGVWRTVLYNGFRFVLGYRDWPTLNTQWRRLS